MKKIIFSTMIAFALVLSGCGDDDSDSDGDDGGVIVDNPTPTQPNENSIRLAMNANNRSLTLPNIAKVEVSPEYAATRPIITIEKTKSAVSDELFKSSMDVLGLQEAVDYEVLVTSDKPLNAEFDLVLNIPDSLMSKVDDDSYPLIYYEVPDDEFGRGMYMTIDGAQIDTAAKTVTVKVPLDAIGNSDVKFKLALATVINASDGPPAPAPAVATAVATEDDLKLVELQNEGPEQTSKQNYHIDCPLSRCIEDSRRGSREGKGNKMGMHRGIDLRTVADTNEKRVAAVFGGRVTIVNPREGAVYVQSTAPDGQKIELRYLHMNIDSAISEGYKNRTADKPFLIDKGTILGIGSNVAADKEHLHLEGYMYAATVSLDEATKKAIANVDLFPYLLHTVKIVNTSKKSRAFAGEQLILALEGKSVNGREVSSEARPTPNYPRGKPRNVEWSTTNSDVSDIVPFEDKVINGKVKLPKATLTIKKMRPAEIRANWEGEGVETLVAPYRYLARFSNVPFKAERKTQSDCEGDSGEATINSVLRSLDPDKSLYRIEVGDIVFDTLIPGKGSKTFVYPEDNGVTTDTLNYDFNYAGFTVNGTYSFKPQNPFGSTCRGSYTVVGTYGKPIPVSQ